MIRVKSILILLFAITIVACGNNNSSNENKAKKAIVDKSSSEETKSEIKKTEPISEVEQPNEPLPPEQLEKAKEILAEVNASAISAIDAEKIFKMHCASCHGFKGNMMVNGAKDLTKSTIDIVNSVAQVYHGKGLMTPYKGLLKSEEIVAVCQYIETLR